MQASTAQVQLDSVEEQLRRRDLSEHMRAVLGKAQRRFARYVKEAKAARQETSDVQGV